MSSSNSSTNLYYFIHNQENREFRGTSPPQSSHRRRRRAPPRARHDTYYQRLTARLERTLERQEIRICNAAYQMRERRREQVTTLKARYREMEARVLELKEERASRRETLDLLAVTRDKLQKDHNFMTCERMVRNGWRLWWEKKREVKEAKMELYQLWKLLLKARRSYRKSEVALKESWCVAE